MEKICLVAALVSALTAFGGSPVRSSERASERQQLEGKQKGQEKKGEEKKGEGKVKDEEKEKDESGKKVSGPLGAKTNPVRCESPRGERAYLSRLRCPDGERPTFARIGSFGPGPYGNIIDGYMVKCEGREEATVFMDMYHEGYVEKEAVPGFTIVE